MYIPGVVVVVVVVVVATGCSTDGRGCVVPLLTKLFILLVLLSNPPLALSPNKSVG